MSDQPKATGEWTADRIRTFIPQGEAWCLGALADAINAELAAEREKAQPLVDALKPFAFAAEELTPFRSIEAKDTFVWKPTSNHRETAGITAQDLLNAKDALSKVKEGK